MKFWVNKWFSACSCCGLPSGLLKRRCFGTSGIMALNHLRRKPNSCWRPSGIEIFPSWSISAPSWYSKLESTNEVLSLSLSVSVSCVPINLIFLNQSFRPITSNICMAPICWTSRDRSISYPPQETLARFFRIYLKNCTASMCNRLFLIAVQNTIYRY